jgi:hypothetical protein
LVRNEHTVFMASAFRVTAGNNHFGKSDALFHSPRAVGGAHVSIFPLTLPARCGEYSAVETHGIQATWG